MGGVFKTAGSESKCVCYKKCTQKFRTYWYFEEVAGQDWRGRRCDTNGPKKVEYWGRPSLNKISEPQCNIIGDSSCDCEACDNARTAALNAVRPKPEKAYGYLGWYPVGPCSECNTGNGIGTNTCYEPTMGNNGPRLPTSEVTAEWSCECEVRS
jgi:hypothetical protein